ncbi:MAG: sugar ABC transporter permease [Oceanipulchritudo sp.]
MKRRFYPYPRATPYLFLMPFLVVFLVFLIYPLIHSVVLAFEQTFGPEFKTFVFLDNFIHLFKDPLFYIALKNTAIYATASITLQLPLSLGLALLMNRPDVRGRAFFRLIFFSPSLVGAVFVGVMFAIIFQKRTGLLNVILHELIGFNLDFPWLQVYVMPALILAALWMWTGFNMIYFLAALQNVDRDLMDAARIDGAGPIGRFRYVILPAIRPIAGFVVLLSLIGSFQLFELPYLLLNSSAGPDNKGLTIVMYLYQTGFQTGDLGYASAIGWALAIILVVLATIQRRLSRSEEI